MWPMDIDWFYSSWERPFYWLEDWAMWCRLATKKVKRALKSAVLKMSRARSLKGGGFLSDEEV